MFLRLLKSEFYRARKQKNPYILLVFLLLAVLLTCLVLIKFDFLSPIGIDRDTYVALTAEGNSMEGIDDAVQLGTMLGSEIDSETEIIGKGIFYDADVNTLFNMVVAELDVLLLLTIFVGIFIGDIFSMGIEKNLVICNNKRSTLFLARATVIAIYALILHVFTFIFTIISVGIMGNGITFDWNKYTVGYLFLSYLLTVAFGIVIYAVTVATKSKAAGITIGVILSTGALASIISVANWYLVNKFDLKSDFSIANYFITENLVTLGVPFTSTQATRAIVVSVVFIAAAVAVIMSLNKKRDIV